MTGPTLPPLVPSHAVPASANKAPAKPRHDFAPHVRDDHARPSPGRASARGATAMDTAGEREPAAHDVPLLDAVATTALTDVALAADGGRVFAQSLRVVGYLSMLGQGLSPPAPALAAEPSPTAATAASTAADQAAQADVADTTTAIAHADEASESLPPAMPSATARTAGRDGDDVRTVQAAQLFAERKPFARRMVRLGGDTIFMRDFSLDKAAALAVLNGMRATWAEGQHATRAVVNGHTLSIA